MTQKNENTNERNEAMTISQAAAEMTALVAAAATTSYDAIDQRVAELGRSFRRPAVEAIAAEMGIPGSFASKKAALATIHRRIAGHKESMERCSF